MREILRLEVVLKRHYKELTEMGLLEKKPSKPREFRKGGVIP